MARTKENVVTVWTGHLTNKVKISRILPFGLISPKAGSQMEGYLNKGMNHLKKCLQS
jgi:hypothetical protein